MNPLARIVYNMVAEGAEAGAKASADDVLRAAGKIADEGVQAADDWGWKGDPTGRLTGGKYRDAFDSAYNRWTNNSYNPWDEAFADTRGMNDELVERFSESSDPFYQKLAEYRDEVAYMADVMRHVETADVPIEWTGKVAKILYRSPDLPVFTKYLADSAKSVSDAMRPMTNEQRETFLSLLPEWTESLDDLANAVKTL